MQSLLLTINITLLISFNGLQILVEFIHIMCKSAGEGFLLHLSIARGSIQQPG